MKEIRHRMGVEDQEEVVVKAVKELKKSLARSVRCYALAYPKIKSSVKFKVEVSSCNQKSSSKTRSLSYGASQCSSG